MNIGLDARAIFAPQPTGIGNYLVHLVMGLHERGHVLTLLTNTTEHAPDLPKDRIRTAAAPGTSRYMWEQLALPRLLRAHPVDLYHATWNFGIPMGYSHPCVVTVHDVIPLVLPTLYRPSTVRGWIDAAAYRFFLRQSLSTANAVVAVSRTSADDLATFYPFCRAKTRVSYEGCDVNDPSLLHHAEITLRKRFGITGTYLVYFGGFERRKDVEALLRIFPEIRDRYHIQLVLIGHKNAYFTEQLAMLIGHGMIVTGYLDTPSLQALVRGAAMLVYPSLYEGFGLPVLEAMQLGTPVVTGKHSSLQEIAGDAALLVETKDPEALRSAIVRLLDDEALRLGYRQRGHERAKEFSWKRMVDEHEEVYSAAVSSW